MGDGRGARGDKGGCSARNSANARERAATWCACACALQICESAREGYLARKASGRRCFLRCFLLPAYLLRSLFRSLCLSLFQPRPRYLTAGITVLNCRGFSQAAIVRRARVARNTLVRSFSLFSFFSAGSTSGTAPSYEVEKLARGNVRMTADATE